MNIGQLTAIITSTISGKSYSGGLTQYAVSSIETGRSNYAVSNLLKYCDDMGIRFVLIDSATEERYYPDSVLDIHKIFKMLMERYEIELQDIFKQTGMHYTPPVSYEDDQLEFIQSVMATKKSLAPLSVKMLLAVCEMIPCELVFKLRDEKQ